MNLIQEVYSILTPLNLPILWQRRPDKFPGITYHFFNETGELYGDGDYFTESVACQIDIWSKNDYTEIKKQVKSAMKEAGFLFSNATDTYEKDVDIYHCVLTFNLYYESEE